MEGLIVDGSLSVIGYGLGAIGGGVGVGLSALGATNATARQPEMQAKIFQTFILGAAFSEALGLIGFVLVLIS